MIVVFNVYQFTPELEELRHAKQELEDNCYLLEAQLRQQQDEGDIEKRKLLSRYRHKQIELKKQIQSLEEQKRRLSLTKDGVNHMYILCIVMQ